MKFLRSPAALAAALVCLALSAPAAAADSTAARPEVLTLVNTPAPGGFFGYWGADVFSGQRVAARFSVPAGSDVNLARVGLWLMNNSDAAQHKLRVSVQTDALDEGGASTLPSGRILARWVQPVTALGWNPVEQFFRASPSKSPVLQGGRDYWVVAESRSPALVNPVWTFSKSGTGWSVFSLPDGTWQTAGEGAALTLQVDVLPR